MKEFNWELKPHLPYSPDTAPSDYHLFRGLESLPHKKNQFNMELKKDSFRVFCFQNQVFLQTRLHILLKRWRLVILDNDEKYIID